MSDEHATLVPTKIEEASDAQKVLMLLLNEQICALFKEDDILLKPSPEMNHKERWVHLKLIEANPQVHVGYRFDSRPCTDSTGYFWLNVALILRVVNEVNDYKIIFLTPNQTHWILNTLKENELLREKLKAYAKFSINNLRETLTRSSEAVNSDKFWEDNGKFNPVFDVATKDARRRGYYTSWDIFMENVLPPPPWIHPFPALQETWRLIMQLGKRPII